MSIVSGSSNICNSNSLGADTTDKTVDVIKCEESKDTIAKDSNADPITKDGCTVIKFPDTKTGNMISSSNGIIGSD